MTETRADAVENADLAAIDTLTVALFAGFVSGPNAAAAVDSLRDLFLPGAVITRTCGDPPTSDDVDGFLAPRRALLSSGTLTDFREWELTARTQIFGDVAHRWSSYAKSWSQDGAAMTGRGVKTLQLVRTPAGWRIAALAWDDERDGLVLPRALG